MTKIIMETSVVNDIPILGIFQEKLYSCPLVFFIHGYGADREQAIDYGNMLAKKGFYYVSRDCKGHGDNRYTELN